MHFFEQKFGKKMIILDGACGSNLAKRGMPSGVCPEKWILEHPDTLILLQKEYVAAGSNIIYAPTFGANRIKLSEYGLENEVEAMNKALVALSKEAADKKALVAGDITMTGKQLKPIGTLDFEELVDVYKEQARALFEAGCDLIVAETMMSLQETRAAVLAVKEATPLPVIVTLSFEKDGRTLFGTDARTAAVVLEGLGVDAVGANCSIGPDLMKKIIKEMYNAVSIPIIAKPNAGLPSLNAQGETIYSMDEISFAKGMEELIENGASIVGGCCGTTPKFIKAVSQIAKQLKTEQDKPKTLSGKSVLASEHQSLFFDADSQFLVIGERINPTGKKRLQASLREGSFDMVTQFAIEQTNQGADILDINMGMSGIDENEMLKKAMQEVQNVSNLPLSIDSSNCMVVENALRIYPGRALVNSVSLESGKAEALFPLIKKYGAMFILLPLSDLGLPQSFAEKKEIIDTLLKKAYAYGLSNKDIIVDGLVTTVSANKMAALETLETIRYCKSKNLATVVGLSNISFGLPERSNVNTAFLTTAISQGLTMAIANPSQKDLMNAAFATDMLMNKTNADLRYIEKMTNEEEVYKHTNTSLVSSGEDTANADAKTLLRQAVLRGNTQGIVERTKAAMKEADDAQSILNEVLLPAINEVGDLFNIGKYFLPQLIASANAMKESIEYLEPFMHKTSNAAQTKTIVIASVKGDIHDIGKNLVALMMRNYGYRVIDLGKDVDTDCIIQKAMEEKAEIIALSALMTTTMAEMKNVVKKAKEAKLSAQIIIGGAVITQEYADEISADGYSKDAADAIKLLDRILNKEGSFS